MSVGTNVEHSFTVPQPTTSVTNDEDLFEFVKQKL